MGSTQQKLEKGIHSGSEDQLLMPSCIRILSKSLNKIQAGSALFISKNDFKINSYPYHPEMSPSFSHPHLDITDGTSFVNIHKYMKKPQKIQVVENKRNTYTCISYPKPKHQDVSRASSKESKRTSMACTLGGQTISGLSDNIISEKMIPKNYTLLSFITNKYSMY